MSKQGIIETPPQTGETEQVGGTALFSPVVPFYADEYVTIYHGDSREIMPHLKPFDLLLTDPPYGIGEGKKAGRRTKAAKGDGRWQGRTCTDYQAKEWDDEAVEEWAMHLARRLCEKQIIFGGNYYDLPPTSCWLVWDKMNGESDFADCELAWSNMPKAVRRKAYLWNGFQRQKPERREHPTQKPLEVMAWALKQAGDVQTVLDPWMGSGTTLRACKDAHVHCVGIEREREYCEIAVDRMAQTTMGF
jgi:site-specific DNA-methyltransferase (adenine-specific)/modification methylase